MTYQHNLSSDSPDFLPDDITEQGFKELVEYIDARIAGGDSPLGSEGEKAFEQYGGTDATDAFSKEVNKRVRTLRRKIVDAILPALGLPPGDYGRAILKDEVLGGQAAQNN